MSDLKQANFWEHFDPTANAAERIGHLKGDPQRLWDACATYFTWAQENPMYEAKLISFQGVGSLEEVPKMRAFTVYGLCNHLGITVKMWHEWKAKNPEDLAPVMEYAEQICHQQKIDGAAADLLNPTVVLRLLGLPDRQEISGPNGGPMRMITEEMDPKEAAEAYAATLTANQG